MRRKSRKSDIRRTYGLMLLCLLVLTGCGDRRGRRPDEDAFSIYYVNNSETAILSRAYTLQAAEDDTESAVEELLVALATVPEHLEYEAPLAGKGQPVDHLLNAGLLTLSFEADYMQIDRTTEILNRAATVRTLTQLPGVDYVTYQVAGVPLATEDGTVIGNMSADTFIYNAGNEINSYERVELALYFATQDGTELIEVYRNVVYNSNISMQRLAVEQLLRGPNIDVAHPVLNPQTKINSITVRDGICYIDLDSSFLTPAYPVTPEVMVYSIVNTLAE
ncbi:MAG: GerMN domain-containing protein, partial [Butyrivibrio sp.]|nr:GerMN domain-containing protein [Butyrivibrio sp.]